MRLGLILAVTFTVALIGAAAILYFVGFFQPSIKEIELVMVDYGYNKASFAPTLTVKAGEVVVIRLKNNGAHPHEFMVVPNKDMALMMMKNLINEIDQMDLSEEEKLELYEERHMEMMMNMDKMYDFEMEPSEVSESPGMIMVTVLPGEELTIRIVINDPGSYWYLCQEADGTWPQIHQEKGMVGKLIVEEG